MALNYCCWSEWTLHLYPALGTKYPASEESVIGWDNKRLNPDDVNNNNLVIIHARFWCFCILNIIKQCFFYNMQDKWTEELIQRFWATSRLQLRSSSWRVCQICRCRFHDWIHAREYSFFTSKNACFPWKRVILISYHKICISSLRAILMISLIIRLHLINALKWHDTSNSTKFILCSSFLLTTILIDIVRSIVPLSSNFHGFIEQSSKILKRMAECILHLFKKNNCELLKILAHRWSF